MDNVFRKLLNQLDKRLTSLVKVDEKYDGFALVHKNNEGAKVSYSVAEFFIMKGIEKTASRRTISRPLHTFFEIKYQTDKN